VTAVEPEGGHEYGWGLNHAWPAERDATETRVGITYCRFCGRALRYDRHPEWRQSKPCSTPGISFGRC
jgi:hypothetical protein